MLQSFIVQNPTPDELHFLLSVRASCHSAGVRAGWTKEDVPEEGGPELGVGSSPGTWRLEDCPSSGIAVALGQLGAAQQVRVVVRGP